MPNLKSALLSHQAQLAAHKSRQKSTEAHQKAKASSIKASLTGSKKGLKRQRTDAAGSSSSKPSTSGKALVPRPKGQARTFPFDKSDTILLLGEANFSFALSLMSPPHELPPCQILATSYDSREVCFEKYPDAFGIVRLLEEKGVRVEFGVDAGKLEGKVVGKGRRWSRVLFNFPHAGAGIKDQDRNILSNQTLLLRTLRAVHPILTTGPSLFPNPTSGKGKGKSKRKRKANQSDSEDEGEPPLDEVSDLELEDDHNPFNPLFQPSTVQDSGSEFTIPNREGTLLITHLNQPPYTLWNLPKLAQRPPPSTSPIPKDKSLQLQPKYRLLRSFQFHPDLYPGYAHRRTIGFKEGVSKAGNEEIRGRGGEARTWQFAPVPQEAYDDEGGGEGEGMVEGYVGGKFGQRKLKKKIRGVKVDGKWDKVGKKGGSGANSIAVGVRL